MRCSHSSSSDCGRALSAGTEPTIPALHCAITRSGQEMMNMGEPITGSRSREIGRATSELQSLMRISYAVFCLKKKKRHNNKKHIEYVTSTHQQPAIQDSHTTTI